MENGKGAIKHNQQVNNIVLDVISGSAIIDGEFYSLAENDHIGIIYENGKARIELPHALSIDEMAGGYQGLYSQTQSLFTTKYRHPSGNVL